MAGSDKTCSIEGCGKSVVARGWCSMHYTRNARFGSPTARLRGEVVDGCRICPQCGEDKPLEAYSSRGACKPCIAERVAQKRADNPDTRAARLAYMKQYNARNAERLRALAIQWRRDNPEKVRKQSAARRAAVRGAAVVDFMPSDVFERDGWTCHLCRLPVDRMAAWPHPLSVSLDHITPLSRGGDHSPENTACSHLRCNLRKYNALPKGA